MTYSVLLVDDDPKLVQLLQAYFSKDNFIVYTAADGITALSLAKEKKPSIMVLDLMLPGMEGWEVCRQLRKSSDLPIIMLTAREEESDKLIGLEIGADDYVTKPFSPKEVVARVKAILRRTTKQPVTETLLVEGPLVIDVERHQVTVNDEPVELTATEFKILQLLVVNRDRVLSRLQIVEQIQGDLFEGYERTIDAHIKNLRRKIEMTPKEPKYILTVYGVGYKFSGESNG